MSWVSCCWGGQAHVVLSLVSGAEGGVQSPMGGGGCEFRKCGALIAVTTIQKG